MAPVLSRLIRPQEVMSLLLEGGADKDPVRPKPGAVGRGAGPVRPEPKPENESETGIRTAGHQP